MTTAFCPKSSHISLKAQGISCHRGGRTVFSGLDLELLPGAALALTGRNGSGKTSLLRILAGLLEPAAGTVRILGGSPDAGLAEQAHFIGAQDGLRPALTAAEHVAFWRGLLGGANAAPDILGHFGLASLAGTPVEYLSSGQRRRLALTRLFAAPRPVWLLDEPMNALDAAARAMLRTAVGRHLASGGIAVIATHDALGIGGVRELALGGPGGAA